MRFFYFQKVKLKFRFILTLLLSILLVSGCAIVVLFENNFSFVFSIIMPLLAVLNFLFLLYWLLKKSKYVIYALLSLTVFFFSFDSFVQCNSKNENTPKKPLSILTYNVKGNSLKKDQFYGTRNHQILQFVKKQDPDIVVFQEFWNYGFVKYYMYPYRFVGYRSEISKSLQFVLSKYPIINQGYIDFPDTLNNAMFVDIDYEGEVIRLYNIHLQSFGLKINSELASPKKGTSIFSKISHAQNLRRNQVKLVQDHEKEFEGKTILCGDFNSTPFSSTYKILKGSRKDTFLEAGCGLGTTYSLKGYPLRLDYILTDKDFEVISHQNFNINLSDHEPILTTLNVN